MECKGQILSCTTVGAALWSSNLDIESRTKFGVIKCILQLNPHIHTTSVHGEFDYCGFQDTVTWLMISLDKRLCNNIISDQNHYWDLTSVRKITRQMFRNTINSGMTQKVVVRLN